jgi:hypothetical protein
LTYSRRAHLIRCVWFWAWVPVGAGAALSVISFIGTLTALPVALVIFLMARKPSVRESSFGFLSGVGVMLLYVAWIQRSGEWIDPRPLFALGVALFVAGIAGHTLRERGVL